MCKSYFGVGLWIALLAGLLASAAAASGTDQSKSEPAPAEAKPGGEAPQGVAPGQAIPIAQGQITIMGTSTMKIQTPDGGTKTVTENGGVKTTTVEQKDKKITIEEDQQGGIKVVVSEKRNGKHVVKTYEAKDIDELRTKHPKGYKLFIEHGANPAGAAGAGQIQVQVGGAGGMAIPLPAIPGGQPQGGQLQIVPIQPGPGGAPMQILVGGMGAAPQLDLATSTMMLKSFNEQLKGLGETDSIWKDAKPQAKQDLKKELDEMKTRIGEIEKRLAKTKAAKHKNK